MSSDNKSNDGKCPNCGAAANNLSTCEYCGSVLQTKNEDVFGFGLDKDFFTMAPGLHENFHKKWTEGNVHREVKVTSSSSSSYTTTQTNSTNTNAVPPPPVNQSFNQTFPGIDQYAINRLETEKVRFKKRSKILIFSLLGIIIVAMIVTNSTPKGEHDNIALVGGLALMAFPIFVIRHFVKASSYNRKLRAAGAKWA